MREGVSEGGREGGREGREGGRKNDCDTLRWCHAASVPGPTSKMGAWYICMA